ncbi:AsmA-like C-terminal region-containing protein [Pontibacter sp. 13R65]|uniref:AsmA-like C-terminal region-containing protein n=1 Tax=Pontibacter sp. 13R65 TaxID=3127458 RepID=UPI00301D234C
MRNKIIITLTLILLLPVVLLVTASMVVYRNQKQITQKVIASINENFDGELVVKDSFVSLFENFPYVSIDLHQVAFYGTKSASNKPLYEIEDLYAGFDLLDLLNGKYHVKRLKIKGGHLDVVKHANGDINLLLAKGLTEQSTDTTSSEDFYFDLKELVLQDFELSYADEAANKVIYGHLQHLKASIRKGADHLFTDVESAFILDIDKNGEHTFFNNKHMALDLTLDYDKLEQKLLISPSQLSLEESLFGLKGTVDFDDDLNLSLDFTAEKPDFNTFIAFAPNDLATELRRYENQGNIYFRGKVEGKASNGHTPAIAVDFGCENAYFLNKAVNKKVDDMQIVGTYTNGQGRSLETSELRLEKMYAKPDEGVFTGRLFIQNFADPQIAVNLNADLDLEFLGAFLGVEGLQKLKGQVLLDMNFDELIHIDKPNESLSKLKEGIESELTVKNLSFQVPGYPHPITAMNAHATMQQGAVNLDFLRFKIAGSDFALNGKLNDLPAIFHQQTKPITFNLQARSGKINIPQLLQHDTKLVAITDEEITDFAIKLAFVTSTENLLNYEYLPRGEFFIDDFFAKLKHYPHSFHDFHADVIITDKALQLKDFSGQIDASDFHFSGLLNNYPKWFQEVKTGDTRFEFDFSSKNLKMQDLLSYKGNNYLPEDYRHEEIKELKLHGRLDLHYDSVFKSADLQVDKLEGKLKIHPLKLEKVAGRVHYEDERLQVENLSGRVGKSDFKVNLTYYTGLDPILRKRHNQLAIYSRYLDLDELMNYNTQPQSPGQKQQEAAHAEAFNIFEVPFTDMRVQAQLRKVNYHHIFLQNLRANMRLQENHYLYVDTLQLGAAGGKAGMSGYFNGSNPAKIYFKSTIAAHNLDLDKLMLKFDNFGQDYMVNENLHGKLSGTISSTVRMHPDLTPILAETEATLAVTVQEGSLVNFSPMLALSDYFKDKNLNLVRFDTLQNTFSLKKGVLDIPSMQINSSLGFIEMSGKQSLDLNMDYFIRVPLGLVTQVGFKTLFGGKSKEEVDPDQVDEIVYRNEDKRVRFLNLNVSGNADDYKITLGKDKKRG